MVKVKGAVEGENWTLTGTVRQAVYGDAYQFPGRWARTITITSGTGTFAKVTSGEIQMRGGVAFDGTFPGTVTATMSSEYMSGFLN